MNKTIIGALFAALVGSVGLVPASKVLAQQPACLHAAGESADQQLRRRQGLLYTRQINTAEARAFSQAPVYQPLNLLRIPPSAPEGFVAHLAVDANGYAFSIKDSTDPCGFAYFSDQDGVIFAGEYIR